MSCLREVQTISKSPHILPMPSLTRLTSGGVLNPLKNTTNTSHNELLHQDPLQPPLEPRAALFDVNRPISHVIPLRVFQALKSHRWDCNVCGVSRKMTMLNYVRLWGGGIPRAPAARSSSASSLSVLPGTASGTQQLEPSQLVAASSLALFRQSQFSNAT